MVKSPFFGGRKGWTEEFDQPWVCASRLGWLAVRSALLCRAPPSALRRRSSVWYELGMRNELYASRSQPSAFSLASAFAWPVPACAVGSIVALHQKTAEALIQIARMRKIIVAVSLYCVSNTVVELEDNVEYIVSRE